MKRFILAGIATLAVAAYGTSDVTAAPTALNPYSRTTSETTELIAPSALVTLAHRGQLQAQGIPGYLAFSSEYALGRIGAEEIVQGAIRANLLPAEAAKNEAYLNQVEAQLQIQEKIR